jgi:hypothetical protein
MATQFHESILHRFAKTEAGRAANVVALARAQWEEIAPSYGVSDRVWANAIERVEHPGSRDERKWHLHQLWKIEDFVSPDRWPTGNYFRFFQQSWEGCPWSFGPAFPDGTAGIGGSTLTVPPRDASALSMDERHFMSSVLDRERVHKDKGDLKTVEKAHALLERCPVALILPVTDIDPLDKDKNPNLDRSPEGIARRQLLAVQYAVDVSEIRLELGLGGTRWYPSNTRGGLHGHPARFLPREVSYPRLLSAILWAMEPLLRQRGVPMLRDRGGPEVAFDPTMWEKTDRGRGQPHRVFGRVKVKGGVAVPTSLPKPAAEEVIDRFPWLEPLTHVDQTTPPDVDKLRLLCERYETHARKQVIEGRPPSPKRMPKPAVVGPGGLAQTTRAIAPIVGAERSSLVRRDIRLALAGWLCTRGVPVDVVEASVGGHVAETTWSNLQAGRPIRGAPWLERELGTGVFANLEAALQGDLVPNGEDAAPNGEGTTPRGEGTTPSGESTTPDASIPVSSTPVARALAVAKQALEGKGGRTPVVAIRDPDRLVCKDAAWANEDRPLFRLGEFLRTLYGGEKIDYRHLRAYVGALVKVDIPEKSIVATFGRIGTPASSVARESWRRRRADEPFLNWKHVRELITKDGESQFRDALAADLCALEAPIEIRRLAVERQAWTRDERAYLGAIADLEDDCACRELAPLLNVSVEAAGDRLRDALRNKESQGGTRRPKTKAPSTPRSKRKRDLVESLPDKPAAKRAIRMAEQARSLRERSKCLQVEVAEDCLGSPTSKGHGRLKETWLPDESNYCPHCAPLRTEVAYGSLGQFWSHTDGENLPIPIYVIVLRVPPGPIAGKDVVGVAARGRAYARLRIAEVGLGLEGEPVRSVQASGGRVVVFVTKKYRKMEQTDLFRETMKAGHDALARGEKEAATATYKQAYEFKKVAEQRAKTYFETDEMRVRNLDPDAKLCSAQEAARVAVDCWLSLMDEFRDMVLRYDTQGIRTWDWSLPYQRITSANKPARGDSLEPGDPGHQMAWLSWPGKEEIRSGIARKAREREGKLEDGPEYDMEGIEHDRTARLRCHILVEDTETKGQSVPCGCFVLSTARDRMRRNEWPLAEVYGSRVPHRDSVTKAELWSRLKPVEGGGASKWIRYMIARAKVPRQQQAQASA